MRLHPERLELPLRWRAPRRVFVNSMSDLFHAAVPDQYVAEVFAVMLLSPRHTFQVLTKRHARMRALLTDPVFKLRVWTEACALTTLKHTPDGYTDAWPIPNVWLGISAETQRWADIRVPALADTPAAVRWVSAEPLLGPLDLTKWLGTVHTCPGVPMPAGGTPRGHTVDCCTDPALGWVVAGGESGPGARPMPPHWPRALRDQCTAARVPFFMKQLGAWRPLRNGEYPPPGPTTTLHTRGVPVDPIMVRHGGHNGDLDRWPADLRIRQYPGPSAVAT